MCVAIFQPAGKVITPDRMWAGWCINSDGGGFAYVDSQGVVQIKTGFLTYNEYKRTYDELVKNYPDSPMLVHMRIRSTGDKSAANCHPFPVRGGAMIHNGTMFHPDRETNKDHKCDSRILAESLFNILNYEDVKAAGPDIIQAVGSFNKLVFLYDGGKHVILNENAGTWEDGIWYSNYSCTPRTRTPRE